MSLQGKSRCKKCNAPCDPQREIASIEGVKDAFVQQCRVTDKSVCVASKANTLGLSLTRWQVPGLSQVLAVLQIIFTGETLRGVEYFDTAIYCVRSRGYCSSCAYDYARAFVYGRDD